MHISDDSRIVSVSEDDMDDLNDVQTDENDLSGVIIPSDVDDINDDYSPDDEDDIDEIENNNSGASYSDDDTIAYKPDDVEDWRTGLYDEEASAYLDDCSAIGGATIVYPSPAYKWENRTARSDSLKTYIDPSERYIDHKAYLDMNADAHKKSHRKIIIIIILLVLLISVASVIVTWKVLNDTSGGQSDTNGSVIMSGALSPSDEDTELLRANGYSASDLTGTAGSFAKAFLTFDSANVGNGSWEQTFAQYTASSLSDYENLLVTRKGDAWKAMLSEHPAYSSTVESLNSIEWNVRNNADSNGNKLPYCDITVTITRPECDSYYINSPSLIIDRFEDTYRISFTADGKVKAIQRTGAIVIDKNIDVNASNDDADMTDTRNLKNISSGDYISKSDMEENENSSENENEETSESAAENEETSTSGRNTDAENTSTSEKSSDSNDAKRQSASEDDSVKKDDSAQDNGTSSASNQSSDSSSSNAAASNSAKPGESADTGGADASGNANVDVAGRQAD